MAEKYDFQTIEKKWQARWDADNLYSAKIEPGKTKCYCLTMLPYPSGDLHIGHWYAMTPSDARARYMRMKGYNVMFPIGFDAFGLPAENAAINEGIHPKTWTYANIDRMRGQLRSMGAMWDWKREIVSSDPEYYKWTQWFFTQFFKHGLAYKKLSLVDWCPNCNTTLAREQVWGEDRHCERCDTPVIKKNLEQWYFKITDYAEELLNFDQLDWPDQVKTLQTNWIGKSEGASVIFKTEPGDEIEVFTTRPDTLWGATFIVLAPEHPLVEQLTAPEQRAEVDEYVAQAVRQSDIQREAADREKTGVFIGAYAVNPVNGERVPIWTADYVMMGYGTGAIMAVPAHDQRDFAFARKFGIPIIPVIKHPDAPADYVPDETEDWGGCTFHSEYGDMINSGEFSGTPGAVAKKKVTKWLADTGIGKAAVTYRLRDWLISRQRYWGAPIPIVYCEKCGMVPVPDDQLPVLLPDDVQWKPTGESPLKLHPTWSKTACPVCAQPAVRDTDTMDTFVCSSWYQYRYLSPKYDRAPFDPKEYDYWMPVDSYTGGIEHATMHLIYTRFFTKALRDIGIVRDDEPMLQLRNQGIILGEDSEKMSKSRGNVVAPDELIVKYGADVVRAYLAFFARWSQGGPWSSGGIEGTARWLNRVWNIGQLPAASPSTGSGQASQQPAASQEARALRRVVHQTIKRVTDDFEAFEFNTIVSALMTLTNELYKYRESLEGTDTWDEAVTMLLRMMAPLTPHIAEELWERRGLPYSIHQQTWPEYDTAAAAEELVTIILQVNGKVRDRIQVPADTERAEIERLALENDRVKSFLAGRPVKKVVVVPGKLVNIVA